MTERGYTYTKQGEAHIVTICSGEKRSGGYGIKVNLVEDVEGVTSIIVEETKPKADVGEMVTMALTYPSTTIKISRGIVPFFNVTDIYGNTFNRI